MPAQPPLACGAQAGDAEALLARRLKIIPNLVSGGGWVAKKTVGNKPAIVGKVLKLSRFVGQGYIEVDIDLEVSMMAKHILSVCTPISQRLVIDVAFVLEGQQESELPERLLGGVRIHRINVETAAALERADADGVDSSPPSRRSARESSPLKPALVP